ISSSPWPRSPWLDSRRSGRAWFIPLHTGKNWRRQLRHDETRTVWTSLARSDAARLSNKAKGSNVVHQSHDLREADLKQVPRGQEDLDCEGCGLPGHQLSYGASLR